MTNILQGTPDSPYHVSVGAAMLNEHNQVLCHCFPPSADPTDWHNSAYLMMRETLEPGERLEEAVARGLMEEFGAETEIESYLGSTTGQYGKDKDMEKTTLYFLCRIKNLDESKRLSGEFESSSQLKWFDLDEAWRIFKKQEEREQRPCGNESIIIERIQKKLSSNLSE